MLITCDSCSSKIRVPDSAAGKRVRCPKCATLIRVPHAENAENAESAENAGTGPEGAISSESPPPSPAPQGEKPEILNEPEEDAFSTTPSRPIRSMADDDDEPPRRRGRHDEEDGEEEDFDDDFDVRRRRRSTGVNGLAMTSMILGIVSAVSIPGSCCCGGFWFIGLVCAVLAIVFGFLGKTPGSESYAWTGIICGIVTLVLLVVVIIVAFGFVGLDAVVNQGKGFR